MSEHAHPLQPELARQAQPAAPVSKAEQRAGPQSSGPAGAVAWLKTHGVGLSLTAILLAAALLRLLVLYQARFIGDGDEAITGVMAKHILEGERPIFTYGQSYMAATEAYLTALIYVFTGVTAWAMKIPPLVASLAVVGLNYAVARYFSGSRRAGLFAAALTAAPSLYFTVNGLRAWNHSTETLVGGNLLLLAAYSIIWGPPAGSNSPRWWGYTGRDWRRWGGLGLLAGLSFYGHSLAIYYYLPVVFFLFLRDKLFVVRPVAGAAALGFVVGSWPWWVYNLQTNFGTIAYFLRPAATQAKKEPALEVLGHYASVSWPLATGAYNYWFPTGRLAGLFLVVIFLASLLGWLVARRRGLTGWLRLSLRPGKPIDLLILMVLAAPLIYLVSGAGNVAFTPLDTTGRYLLPLIGILPVIVGSGLAALAGWRPPAGLPAALGQIGAGLLLGAVIGTNLWQYRQADYVAAFQSPYFPELRPPLDNGPVIAYLKSQGIEYATCNHWVGHRLILDSAEAVKCVDYHDLTVGGLDRFERYTVRLLEPGRRVGFIILNLQEGAASLEARLKQLGVTYTRQDIAPYTVIIPLSRPVSPTEVVEQLHYPL